MAFINRLPGGSSEGTATAANVLEGKTFSNDADTGLVGTMVNKGGQVLGSTTYTGDDGETEYRQATTFIKEVEVRGSFAVLKIAPELNAGYIDKDTRIHQTVNNLTAYNVKHGVMVGVIPGTEFPDGYGIKGTFTSDGTATEAQILAGKIAYVKGDKVTGTMNNYANQVTTGNHISALVGGETVYGNTSNNITGMTVTDDNHCLMQMSVGMSGYINGNTQFKQFIKNLNPANIKAGVSVGSLDKSVVMTGTYTSDATATAIQVLEGQIAYVKGVKVTGTMPNRVTIDPIVGAINTANPSVSVHDGSAPQMATQTVDGKTRFCISPKTGYYASQSSYVGIEQGALATTIGLTAAKISTGKTILGIEGTFTGDGTATDAQILSGKVAYSKGVKLTGTMVNKSNSSTEATTLLDNTNSRLGLKIPVAGYYDTTAHLVSPYATIATTIGLTAAKIASNNTILGIAGTFTSDGTVTAADIASGKIAYSKGVKLTGTGANGRFLDFPLSIQATQPTAVKAGHIWIQSSTLASVITSINITEALNVSAANNSLQFVVGETSTSYLAISETKNLTSGGNNITLSTTQNNGGAQTWVVSSRTNPTVTYKLNRPIVYSKINGVLDLETTYIYTGSAWQMLAQKNNYLMAKAGSPMVYNVLTNSMAYSQTLSGIYSYRGSLTQDGAYYADHYAVHKRSGDVFSKYYTIPTSVDYSNNSYTFAGGGISNSGGMYGAVYSYYTSGSGYYYLLVLYQNNGTTFTQIHQMALRNTTGSSSTAVVAFKEDGADMLAVAVRYADKCYVVFKDGTTYSSAEVLYGTGSTYTLYNSLTTTNLWFSGDYLFLKDRYYYAGTSNPDTYMLNRYSVDYTKKEVVKSNSIDSSTTVNLGGMALETAIPFIHKSTGSFVYSSLSGGNYLVVRMYDGVSQVLRSGNTPAISGMTTATIAGHALSLNRDKLAICLRVNNTGNFMIYYYALTINTSAAASEQLVLTLLGTYDTAATSVSGLELCP